MILTDNDKLFDLGSDIVRLAGEGIEVKVDNTSNHMHHKFMLIDDRTLVNGSYNWTRSAAKYNQENIIVSSDTTLIKLFQKEFDKLWNEMTVFKNPVNVYGWVWLSLILPFAARDSKSPFFGICR